MQGEFGRLGYSQTSSSLRCDSSSTYMQAFIYVSAKKKMLGCVVAERIESAYRVVLVGESGEDEVEEGGEEGKDGEEGKEEKEEKREKGKSGKRGKDEEEKENREERKVEEEGKNREERKDEEDEEDRKERKEEEEQEAKDGKREKDEEGNREKGGKGKIEEKGKNEEVGKGEDQSGDGMSQNMGLDGRAKKTRRNEEGMMQIQDGGPDISSAIFCRCAGQGGYEWRLFDAGFSFYLFYLFF